MVRCQSFCTLYCIYCMGDKSTTLSASHARLRLVRGLAHTRPNNNYVQCNFHPSCFHPSCVFLQSHAGTCTRQLVYVTAQHLAWATSNSELVTRYCTASSQGPCLGTVALPFSTLLVTYIPSEQAAFFGFSSLRFSCKSMGRETTGTPLYGILPPEKSSQHVTP